MKDEEDDFLFFILHPSSFILCLWVEGALCSRPMNQQRHARPSTTSWIVLRRRGNSHRHHSSKNTSPTPLVTVTSCYSTWCTSTWNIAPGAMKPPRSKTT